MKTVAAILAAAGLAAAHPHAHFHQRAAARDIVSDMSGSIESMATSLLSKLSILTPVNSEARTADSWLGEATSGDAVVNTFVNSAKEDIMLVVWGDQGSWVNKIQPRIAKMIPAGQNLTVSHAISTVANPGAWAAVYPDTVMDDGQIKAPFGEFTMVNDMWGSSTVDVSFEPNMNGHNMTIETPTCTSDATRCSFVCSNGQDRCGDVNSYTLQNCEAGSQPGASAGQYGGQASGGCMGIAKTGITKITTTLH